LRDADRHTAKPVVGAEFQQNDRWLLRNSKRHTSQTVLRCVAADTQIDDAIAVAFPVQVLLEEIRKILSGIKPEAGGNAVAVARDWGTAIRWRCRRWGWRGCCFWWRRLLFFAAACKQDHSKEPEGSHLNAIIIT